MLAYHHDWITLTGGALPERVFIANVTANFFDVLEHQAGAGAILSA